MERKCLYFAAVIPPDPLKSRVQALKQEFYEKYHFSHALKSPPHITLLPPFIWPETKEYEINRFLMDLSARQSPFDISLNGFGAFKPRVIYLKIIENEWLAELYHTFAGAFYPKFGLPAPPDRPYHPHMTLAFRDVTPGMFYTAWDEWKNKGFEGSFTVNSICLLKHIRKRWEEHFIIPFRKES